MIYRLRYTIGLVKKRFIEMVRSYRIPIIYEQLPNNSHKRLLDLRGLHAGKDCFIVGNGPSLREMDLSLLNGKYCMFFNGAFDLREYTSPEKRIHVCEDRLVFEDHLEALNKLEGTVFFPSDLQHLIKSEIPIITEFQRGYSEKNSDWPHFVDIESQFPIFYWGGTVAYYGLQLAKWMGFENIYIIGVDLSYSIPESVIQMGSVLISTGDDPNHYKSSYFGKGLRWHVPQQDRMLRAFENVSKHPVLRNKIFNAGVGGNLNCFERVNFAKAVK